MTINCNKTGRWLHGDIKHKRFGSLQSVYFVKMSISPSSSRTSVADKDWQSFHKITEDLTCELAFCSADSRPLGEGAIFSSLIILKRHRRTRRSGIQTRGFGIWLFFHYWQTKRPQNVWKNCGKLNQKPDNLDRTGLQHRIQNELYYSCCISTPWWIPPIMILLITFWMLGLKLWLPQTN